MDNRSLVEVMKSYFFATGIVRVSFRFGDSFTSSRVKNCAKMKHESLLTDTIVLQTARQQISISEGDLFATGSATSVTRSMERKLARQKFMIACQHDTRRHTKPYYVNTKQNFGNDFRRCRSMEYVHRQKEAADVATQAVTRRGGSFLL